MVERFSLGAGFVKSAERFVDVLGLVEGEGNGDDNTSTTKRAT